jgi:hypothetical protein
MPDRTCEPHESEDSDDNSWEEEDYEEVPNRPPIALLSVSRALSRRWQGVEDPTAAPHRADEHYLSELSRLAQWPQISADDAELDLLADLTQVVAKHLRARARALRQAHGQLARELAAVAESLGPDGRAALNRPPRASYHRRASREEYLEESEMECATVG